MLKGSDLVGWPAQMERKEYEVRFLVPGRLPKSIDRTSSGFSTTIGIQRGVTYNEAIGPASLQLSLLAI